METMSEPKKQEETRTHWWVLCLACAAVVLDGYDTVALGVSIPAIAKDWAVAPSQFTPALSLTSAGVALGYLSVGRLVAGWERETSFSPRWWCSPSVRC